MHFRKLGTFWKISRVRYIFENSKKSENFRKMQTFSEVYKIRQKSFVSKIFFDIKSNKNLKKEFKILKQPLKNYIFLGKISFFFENFISKIRNFKLFFR